jgi:multidrug efflux pump
MTSLSTILGTLPIALALGAGAESRISMGVAVVGGMFLSTLLTLYIVPTMYSYISEKAKTVSNIDDITMNEVKTVSDTDDIAMNEKNNEIIRNDSTIQ